MSVEILLILKTEVCVCVCVLIVTHLPLYMLNFDFLCGQNEGAWIWIDGILDLIKKHLADLWKDG